MQYKSMIILVTIINVCHKTDGDLNVIPRDTDVKVNDTTYMNCSTSLEAKKIQWRHGKYYVYTGIAILEPYNERFSVEINTLTGACNLVIRSVQPSDAGTYECAEDEGVGETRSAQLVVLDDDPICKSNMHSDGVIGPNSCGIESEEVKLSCSITYHGSVLPILLWRANGYDQSITEGLAQVSSSNNEVTYKLTMKSTLALNNSSYICQTTRTSDKYYRCSSEAINILYIFSKAVTVNLTMSDEVSCFANTSQSCSYKWKWFSGDDSTTESDNRTLKPKKVGTHRCEATCSLGNKSCIVVSMHATVYLGAAPGESRTVEVKTSGQNRLQLLSVLLLFFLLAVAVTVAMLYRRKSRKRDARIAEQKRERERERARAREQEPLQELMDGLPEIYRSDPVFVETLETKQTEPEKQQIRGMTILDEELFVVSRWSSEVEVYDSTKFSFSRQWNLLKESFRAQDMVSCKINKCLYINGYIFGMPSEILRVDPNGNFIKHWSTEDDWGWGLSVTYESNIILTVFKKSKLNEYSPDGQLIREINLSSNAGIHYPWHVIKLTNGHFMVSHGWTGHDLHRVCIVNADEELEISFDGKDEPTIGHMFCPVYMSVDQNGFVMVLDERNSRVILLDAYLKFKREFISKKGKLRLEDPWRILLDESNGRLLVADNKHNMQRILIFTFIKTNEEIMT